MVAKSPSEVPLMTNDEEAERFLALDLSNLDFTKFKPMQLKLPPKGERLAAPAPKPRRRKTG